MKKERENFGGRFAVIMAFAGSAIGLGNIWRFPYMVGEYGGAAFILVYIAASLFLSLPIFIAESVIGRRSRANCIGAMRILAPGTWWKIIGWMSVLTPMIIVSYYSVVGGWSLNYLLRSCALQFTGADPTAASSVFGTFITGTWSPVIFHTAFLLMALSVVLGGIHGGIEKFSKYCMPLLFVMVVVILVYSVSLPGAKEGVEYLVKPDFSKLTIKTCTYALGQSFYSLSLGMGIIITYSSYISKHENLLASSTGTAVADLLFALLAGFAIMPAVFAAGIEPSSGPGLIFQTLPSIFAQMGITAPWLSATVAILFFLTILIAALTSAISLLEVGVAYLVEEHGMKRRKASVIVFLGTWIAGIFCSLSFGPLAGFKIAGLPLFDFFDTFSSNVLLTVGGFLCVVFVGWKMKKADVWDEFTNDGRLRTNAKCFNFIYFLLRYLAPVAVGIIFVSNFIF